MRWIFSRNFSYYKYRKYIIWSLFYMINHYIHYIAASDGRLYCYHFKGEKVVSFKCNTHKGLINISLNSPLTSKANFFFKVSSRSFSSISNSQKSSVCTPNSNDLLNLSPGWVNRFFRW